MKQVWAIGHSKAMNVSGNQQRGSTLWASITNIIPTAFDGTHNIIVQLKILKRQHDLNGIVKAH